MLGASHARCDLPERAFAAALVVFDENNERWQRGGRHPPGAISEAARSAASGSARVPARIVN